MVGERERGRHVEGREVGERGGNVEKFAVLHQDSLPGAAQTQHNACKFLRVVWGSRVMGSAVWFRVWALGAGV